MGPARAEPGGRTAPCREPCPAHLRWKKYGAAGSLREGESEGAGSGDETRGGPGNGGWFSSSRRLRWEKCRRPEACGMGPQKQDLEGGQFK